MSHPGAEHATALPPPARDTPLTLTARRWAQRPGSPNFSLSGWKQFYQDNQPPHPRPATRAGCFLNHPSSVVFHTPPAFIRLVSQRLHQVLREPSLPHLPCAPTAATTPAGAGGLKRRSHGPYSLHWGVLCCWLVARLGRSGSGGRRGTEQASRPTHSLSQSIENMIICSFYLLSSDSEQKIS